MRWPGRSSPPRRASRRPSGRAGRRRTSGLGCGHAGIVSEATRAPQPPAGPARRRRRLLPARPAPSQPGHRRARHRGAHERHVSPPARPRAGRQPAAPPPPQRVRRGRGGRLPRRRRGGRRRWRRGLGHLEPRRLEHRRGPGRRTTSSVVSAPAGTAADGSVEQVAAAGAALGRQDRRHRRPGRRLGLGHHPQLRRPDPHQQPRGRGGGPVRLDPGLLQRRQLAPTPRSSAPTRSPTPP